MDMSSSSTWGGGSRVLLTPGLLREMMAVFGEVEVPDYVLEDMVAAAVGHSEEGNGRLYLTKSTFLRALTADVQLFNPNVNDSDSTHFNDALNATKPWDLKEDGEPSTVAFKSVYTAANIDNNADTYRSTGWFTLVWAR